MIVFEIFFEFLLTFTTKIAQKIGSYIRWTIYNRKYSYQEIYTQKWNSWVGYVAIALLVYTFILIQEKYQSIKDATPKVSQILKNNNLKNGDIIFHTSLSTQSIAIQKATNSKYSHCGIVFIEGKDTFVLEAIEPVQYTPINKWIARGKNQKYEVKRLFNADKILTQKVILEMKKTGDKMIGKSYDLTFEWSDDKIYCSELIWKIYKQSTGIELGKLQKLKEFDLSNPIVKSKMKERYGDKIPKEELVISPVAIFDSKLLMKL